MDDPVFDRRVDEITLRDGTAGWIWPLLQADREQLASDFAELSEESKRLRFLAPVAQLSEGMLQQLVDHVDGVNHIALVVFVESGDRYEPVAIGRIVRYPTMPTAADVAVTVKDSWQGRGVASVLLPVLINRRPEGVTHLVTEVMADNPASLAMLKAIGPVTITDAGHGEVEVRVELTEPVRDADAQGLAAAYRSERRHLRTRDRVCPWLTD